MDAKNLPQSELKLLIARILENLAAGAGKHKLARFQVDLANSLDQDLDTLSYRDTFASRDSSAKGPFTPGAVSDRIRPLLAKAIKTGNPIYLLQCDLKKNGANWEFELKAQSFDEYSKMCADRRPLEDELEPLLLDAAKAESKDWKEVKLTWDSRSEKLRVIVRTPEIKDAPVSPEVHSKYKAIKAFYAAQGFTLESYALKVLGQSKKRVREVKDYYV